MSPLVPLPQFLKTEQTINNLNKEIGQRLKELTEATRQLRIVQGFLDQEETRYRNMELTPEDMRAYRNINMARNAQGAP